MNRRGPILLAVLLLLSFTVSDILLAQVTSGNGYLGYNVATWGRIRVDLFPYTNRQIDRFSAIAAVDTNFVFDAYENGQNVSGPAAVTLEGVDDAIELLTDGSNPPAQFPKLRVGHLLMTWTDVPFLIVRFRFYNDSSAALTHYLGATTIPRVSGIYGTETAKFDSATQTAYFYRAGETPHWGVRLLRHPTYSVKMLGWNVYSSDPTSDASNDSIRYEMTASVGFDTSLTADFDGLIFNVNRGPVTIASGDSADIEYVVAYGGSPEEVISACDSGQARYEKLVTSIPIPPGSSVPSQIVLHQNYPNPFNPSTTIEYTLPHAGYLTLRVCNVLGEEVAMLVDGEHAAGTFKATWDASDLPTGVYFYRLTAGEYIQTKRMVLMR